MATPDGGGGAPRRRRAGRRGAPAAGPDGRGRRPRFSARTRAGIRIGLAILAIVCAGLGIMVAYAALTLPDINAIGQATGTVKILDRNGNVIGEYGAGGQQRSSVTLAQIAPVLQDATIATEDRSFYDEGAINFGRVAKALFVDVIARHPTQGASTITQQLAKLAFFGGNADKSPLRKLREALLANEIDRMYSKQQILEKYLNIINYGHGAYGIEDAGQIYFGKHAKDLTLLEASMLAGIPNAPAIYDPFLNPQDAFSRQHVVLASMVADGKIGQAQSDQIDPTTGSAPEQQRKQQAILAELGKGHRTGTAQSAPHFVEYVREQLNALFADDPSAIASGNITVRTSLDLRIQQKANTAVTTGINQLKSSDANNAAMLMMDSSNGDILAMVGSANFNDDTISGQYNITTGQRRPGSSFKPYVYETGFIDGALKPDTILQDTAAQSRQYGGVRDFDGRFLGPITAAKSLIESRNVSTEQAMDKAGPQNVIDFAHSVGITSELPDNLTTAIGSAAVRMIDHTAGYAAFSNGGGRVTPRSILKVTDDAGNTIFDAGAGGAGPPVMTAQQSDAVTKILLGYPQRWGLNFTRQTAGKSGTTDNFVDAWYMTYTPNFVVATWAGHTDQTGAELPMKSVFGTQVGKAISVPFVNSLTNEVPFNRFQPVAGALSDCASPDASYSRIDRSGCPTPTPTPSPTPTATPQPSATPTPTPAGGITITLPPTATVPPIPPPTRPPTPTPVGGG